MGTGNPLRPAEWNDDQFGHINRQKAHISAQYMHIGAVQATITG